MKISREKAIELLGSLPELLNTLNKIKDDEVFIEILPREKYKSNKQNRLFYALLSCFWASGCSSFTDYDDCRLYYKRMSGIVKKRGERIVEGSWADATFEQAKYVIDMILRDMDLSGVIGSEQGKKYEAILRGINQWYDEMGGNY